ncbi:MAG: ABC transporter permease subunit [Elusimicrobia bacterium]|nr:ABC transporter permease subunit [Elusimicrobiota bacterium]
MKTGELRYGTDPAGGAPYLFQDKHNPDRMIGFEVDLMEAIGKRLGVTAKPVAIDWDQLVPALMRGDFDIALNGLEVTDERKGMISFSHPYYIFSQQITVRQDDARVKKFEDLRGRRVGTMAATLAKDMLEEHGQIKIVTYPGPIEIYGDLELGRIDAAFLDTPMAAFYAGPKPSLKNVGEPVGEGLYAAGLRKDSPILRDKLNAALKKLYSLGELKKIYDKWDLWTQNQEKLSGFFNDSAQTGAAEVSILKFIPLLLQGASVTIAISVLAMALAVGAGFALCVAKLYGNKFLRFLSHAAVEIIRGTPLLLQLYVIYYGLPTLGIKLNAFVAAVLGIGLNYAACESEIYRAGILSVPKGQDEAARSIGMSARQSLFHIILPQAFRVILPPSTNDFIALFKDTSLVSVITVVELTKVYNQAALSSLHFLELGFITAALYFAMSYPLAIWSRRLEANRQHAIIY